MSTPHHDRSSIAPATTAWAGNIATGLTLVVAVGVLVQAILGGVLASGAHPKTADVHEIIGPSLIVPSFAASLVLRLRLRASAAGRRAYAAGIGVTATLIIETALGLIADDHPGVLLLHIPIAVGLFGLLVRQLTSLRRLASGSHNDLGS